MWSNKQVDFVEAEVVPVKYDEERLSYEELLRIAEEMKLINDLLNGRVTLLGTTNQVDDDTSAVETFDVEDETKLKKQATTEDNE